MVCRAVFNRGTFPNQPFYRDISWDTFHRKKYVGLLLGYDMFFLFVSNIAENGPPIDGDLTMGKMRVSNIETKLFWGRYGPIEA